MVNMQAIGHLGKDASVNNVNGKTVINFSIAHSEKFKKADGTEINKTLWVECSYWSDHTKIATYLKKGTQVHVAGTPSLDTYRNQDNVTVAKLRLRISDIQLLGSKEGKNTSDPPAAVAIAGNEAANEDTDDLPF